MNKETKGALDRLEWRIETELRPEVIEVLDELEQADADVGEHHLMWGATDAAGHLRDAMDDLRRADAALRRVTPAIIEARWAPATGEASDKVNTREKESEQDMKEDPRYAGWKTWPLTKTLPAATPLAVDHRECGHECEPGVDYYDPLPSPVSFDPEGCPVIVPPYVPLPHDDLRHLIESWEFNREHGVLEDDEAHDLAELIVETVKEMIA